MNNKEFLSALAVQTDNTQRDTSRLAAALVHIITDCLENEDSIAISGFGTFEVKKKLERVLVNPATKQRMLVPPKMSVAFKVAPTFKERLNSKNE